MLPVIRKLPDFLEADDGGFISIKGHRIGLHHVIREYEGGKSADGIKHRFQALDLALIHRLLAFYLDHDDEVAKYCQEHDAQMNDLAQARANPAPSLDDLKRRANERRSATAG